MPALLRVSGVTSISPDGVSLADELLPATLAAAALPDLQGRGEAVREARRAAMAVGAGRLGNDEIVRSLGMGR